MLVLGANLPGCMAIKEDTLVASEPERIGYVAWILGDAGFLMFHASFLNLFSIFFEKKHRMHQATSHAGQLSQPQHRPGMADEAVASSSGSS